MYERNKRINWFHLVISIMVLYLLLTAVGFSQTESTAKDTTVASHIKRVAILPFDNVSNDPDAGKRITDIFLTELFGRNQTFRVVELGEVEKALIEERVRDTGQLEVDVAKKLGEKLQADYLILGSVVEYKDVRIGNNDYPVMEITARAIDTKTGAIIWSDFQYGRGNQHETVFGIGRIVSFSQLSEMVVKKLVDSFEKKVILGQYIKK